MLNTRNAAPFLLAISSFALCGSLGAAPSASPFGIAQGTPIKALKVQRTYSGKYFVVTPPIANSNFDKYTVLATPRSGVCAIFASSPEYDNADDMKATFDRLVRLLNRYGKSHTVKFSKDWPILELTGEYFPVEWKQALPNNLGSVVVEPLKRGSAYKVEVSYIYRNMASCANWEPNQDRRGL